MARDVAFRILDETENYNNWAIPENNLREWIVDLHVLKLIALSKRKDSLNDKEGY